MWPVRTCTIKEWVSDPEEKPSLRCMTIDEYVMVRIVNGKEGAKVSSERYLVEISGSAINTYSR